jgi:NAD-dependent DNA ligase
MKSYLIEVPKDSDGQPIGPFHSLRSNNAAKAIDQLSGLCAGILADGVVNEAEARFFAEWVTKYSSLEPHWPLTDVVARVQRIFADGSCDDQERLELKQIMEALCGHHADADPKSTYPTTLPLNQPPPDQIVFAGRLFLVTGKFAFGTRSKVFGAIERQGGIAADSLPNTESDYLVIGAFASRDWINTNSGRKIERAVDLRNRGAKIAIIDEHHWRRFVADSV